MAIITSFSYKENTATGGSGGSVSDTYGTATGTAYSQNYVNGKLQTRLTLQFDSTEKSKVALPVPSGSATPTVTILEPDYMEDITSVTFQVMGNGYTGTAGRTAAQATTDIAGMSATQKETLRVWVTPNVGGLIRFKADFS